MIPKGGKDLYFLLQCLKGEPHIDVQYFQDFDQAIHRLDEKYGNERNLVLLLISEIKCFGFIHDGDYEALISFISLLESAWCIIKSRNLDLELNNFSVMSVIEGILPEKFRLKWFESCKGERDQKFERLIKFLTYQRGLFETLLFAKKLEAAVVGPTAEINSDSADLRSNDHASQVLHPPLDEVNQLNSQIQRKKPDLSFNHEEIKPVSCPLHNCKGHSIGTCNIFRKLNDKSKISVARKYGLCFSCLADNHQAHSCGKDVRCNKLVGNELCNGRHHLLLHHAFNWVPIQEIKLDPLKSQREEIIANKNKCNGDDLCFVNEIVERESEVVWMQKLGINC